MTRSPRSLKARGFTLIELIVAMVILAIIATIAISSYSNKVRAARRTQAKSALLDIATREEQLFATTNAYSATASDVGYSGPFPQSVGNGYYSVAITVSAAVVSTAGNVTTPAGYVLRATTLGAQLADSTCAFFQVDSLGNQTATSSNCWN